MDVINASSFTGKYSWDALDIALIEGVTIRLHWADRPYIWHKNNGNEIFVVLDGQVLMRYLENNIEHQIILNAGDICYFQVGEEHVAYPQNGAARILVVEKKGAFDSIIPEAFHFWVFKINRFGYICSRQHRALHLLKCDTN